MIKRIGLIPLENYLHGLQYRGLGRQDSIAYTNEIYNVNLKKEINDKQRLWFDGDINIYKQFEQKYPTQIEDNGSREYFDKYARKRFSKMLEIYDISAGDYFFPFIDAEEVHHIYPLIFSNDNSLFNLIQVNKVFHKILHYNPLENIKESNFQAVDYLWYLSHSGFEYLENKYNLNQYLNPDRPKTMKHIFFGSIEDEMDVFYKYIT